MRWIAACTVGEAIGIAVVSVAYAAGDRFYPGIAGVLIIGAGAVEGLALGTVQALAGRACGVRIFPWISATIAAAIIGYSLSFFIQDIAGKDGAADSAAEPSLWLILLAGAALGLFMGVLFGGLQAFAAPSSISKIGWILRNAVGWAPAMAVIMLAASMAGADWPLTEVGMLGFSAGAVAGLFIGVATKGGLKSSGV